MGPASTAVRRPSPGLSEALGGPAVDAGAVAAECGGRLDHEPRANARCPLGTAGTDPLRGTKTNRRTEIRKWIKDLIQWVKAEIQVLHTLRDTGIKIKNADIWDTFLDQIQEKDDTRPP
ncbi:hypothetical protein NDU88_000401 [Pleurodeles waltl]|uniref:Uncharacterized protein n=1 Tax=Pleurodeles waltl TaxID=8319 RepID=A0AAV7US44_PLEWA|nr:hypothetical protein NDU88_000401 [Pleurodeles waltl]